MPSETSTTETQWCHWTTFHFFFFFIFILGVRKIRITEIYQVKIKNKAKKCKPNENKRRMNWLNKTQKKKQNRRESKVTRNEHSTITRLTTEQKNIIFFSFNPKKKFTSSKCKRKTTGKTYIQTLNSSWNKLN